MPVQLIGAPVQASALAAVALTIAKPAGPLVNGDYLIAHLRAQASNSTAEWSLAGWDRAPTPAYPGAGGSRVTTFLYRLVTDATSEPASYTFGGLNGGNQRVAGSLFILRGIHPAVAFVGSGGVYGGAVLTNGRRVAGYMIPDPAVVIYAGDTERASPNATRPVTLPAGYTEIDFVTANGTATNVSRTTAWTGMKVVTGGTTVDDDTLWPEANPPGANCTSFAVMAIPPVQSIAATFGQSAALSVTAEKPPVAAPVFGQKAAFTAMASKPGQVPAANPKFGQAAVFTAIVQAAAPPPISETNEIGCTVLIDGMPINDGCVSTDPSVPTVLSGLKIKWGRDSTVDQPQAATCTFNVIDPLYGDRLVPSLTIGRRVDVRVDAIVYTDPDTSINTTLYPSSVTGANSWQVSADGKTAVIQANGNSRSGFYLPPLPFSSSPFAWDSVPRTLPGQEWRFEITITPPKPIAGYSGWAAEVAPAYFTRPDGSDVSQPGPWIPADPTADATFVPPPGVWVGLGVHLWPVGPAWNQIDSTSWNNFTWADSLGPIPSGGYKITAFGDSITAGTWLPTYADSWIPKLATKLGVAIANRAVGGVPLHDYGGGPVLMDQITAALAVGQPAFNTAIILIGTNDLVTHTDAQLVDSANAAHAVQNKLLAAGIRPIWVSILPMGSGSSHPDGWLPDLLRRRQILNRSYLRPMAGRGHWFETDKLFGADANGLVTDASYLLDGLHPSAKGADQMAAQFPAELINPSFTGWHPSWDELATFVISNMQIIVPIGGAADSGMVFSGRITDVIATWDGSIDSEVQIIAQDWRAELANRFVGDQPWIAEVLWGRAVRIIQLSGQPIQMNVDAGVANLMVSYRDVDRQSALDLVQQLAISCGGILWTATHLVTGQNLRIEDVAARPAALTLTDAGTGLVHVIPSPAAIANSLPITSCNIDLDPVRFILDTSDTISMVAVQWMDQTKDEHTGLDKPTQRTVEVVAPETMAAIGARRMSVSTQLISLGDATAQANQWLARSSPLAWRVEGLRWDTADYNLSPDEIQTVLTLLDGTSRNGLPIALTELPPWTYPMTGNATEVALYLEGGTYTYNAGHWQLELQTSSATGSAVGNLPWNALDAGWAWNEFDPGVTYPLV
jgi:lysophospholipase L1-like esterase